VVGGLSNEAVPILGLVLDRRWKQFQDQVLFTNLCKILQRQTKVNEGWRYDLRRAALLVGESVGANDLLKSFIWNMAALETLLTKRDQERAEDAVQWRAEALLGWVRWGEVADYEGAHGGGLFMGDQGPRPRGSSILCSMSSRASRSIASLVMPLALKRAATVPSGRLSTGASGSLARSRR
jgi:hypothetical protein